MAKGGFARQTSGGGGGGSANVGALLQQADNASLGLFISSSRADESWHLRAAERGDAEPSVGSTAVFPGTSAANSLSLAFFDASDTTLKRFNPLVGNSRQDQPEQVNTYRFNYVEYPDPTPVVLAFYDYGDLKVTTTTTGADGNDDRVQVSIGTAAVPPTNAHADIPLYNGTPGVLRAGQIRVTSPDRAQGGNYAAPPSYFILDRFSFRATERGTAGNALEFQIRSVVDADQTEAETWTAVYTDDNTLRVTVTFNSGVSTERRTFTSSLFVAAFNAATDSNGNRPITLIDGFPSHPDSVTWRLATGTNAPFSGGTDVSGGGAPTNFGGIELVSSGPRSAAVQASVTWGNVVLTANAAGAFPNDGKYQAQVVGTNSGGHQFRVTRSDLTGGRHFQILIDSSVGSAPTVAQVIQGLNDADTEDLITASAASGVSDTSVAWTGTGTQSFIGGADAVNPLAASWDEDTHTLTITALDSDPASAVITAITALDEFGTNVGPGYVRLAGGGLNSGVINVDDTVGNTLDYDFAGGTDGAPRTILRVVNRNDSDGDGNLLAITGLISGDTTQDVIDAFSGNRFTLTSVSGDGTTAFSNPTALAATSLAGGLDNANRQTPRVHVSDAGSAIHYTIEYHGQSTKVADRTTLTELKTAWENIPAVDGVQGASPTATLSRAAAGADTVGAGVPTAPTGGDDYVPAGEIEALVRPNDEVNGPNIEVRYDPARENIGQIATALNAQGAVNVVEVYGTDNTATPEEPSFVRSMYQAAGTRTGGTADPFDLHDDVSRSTATLNANGLDRFLISQEAVAGDPNTYITAENARTFMKGYVGTWSSRPGGFVFRKGDVTDHSGQWYVTTVQHTKQSNGPDTDPTNFQAVTYWGGAWTAKYFHVGTFVTHSSNVYIATQGVSDSDPAPDHADNTKWVQISGGGNGEGADLSDDTPEPAGTAAAGTSTEASRADHVHAAELGDDVITPAMLDADGAADKAALRTRIGAVSARANPTEAVDGGELTGIDIDGTIYEVPEGRFDLSDKVGNTITGIGATAVQGPDFADLTPAIWLSFSYTRTPNSSLRFNTLVRKADLEGVVAGSAYRLQAQGAGGAYFNLYDTGDKLTITNSDTGALPTVSLDVYNVKGSTGAPGGGADLSLADPQPLGTADPGTGTEASRSDHVHPSELVDDSITPAMLVADSAGEKTAMRNRIGAGTSNVGNTQIDARINSVARTGNTDKWPTNKLDDDVVLSAELTAAIAGFLSQTQVDARVTTLVNALALASSTARWGKARLPTDTVYDADIANFRTATQITASINAALAGFADWENQWGAGTAYSLGRVVRHNSAAYIALRAVAANTAGATEPGVGTAWTTSWYRLGYANGAPSSLVTPTFDTGNGELVLTDRGGTAHRTAIPTGGTTVEANPSGSDGTDLDRISVGGANFNIPHFRPIQIGNADFGNSPDGNFRLHTSGTGIDKPASIATGEWWGVTSSSQQAGRNLRIFPADEVPTTEAGVAANDNNGLAIGLSHNRDLFLAFNSAGKLVAAGSSNAINVNEVTLFRMGLGDDPAAGPSNLHPSIASFVNTRGDLSPAAGSIASQVYGASWAISQSDHVGSARIIGFKGAFNASNVAVLHSLVAGSYAHGSTTFAIPNGITLAADETYTLRLQVFDEGVTSPGNATQPAAYHDIVITAHAAATANYQWGYAEQVDGETAAQTAARIAGWTSWADSDTTDGGMVTETDGVLNTTSGYSAFAPDVSDSDGTNLFVFFLAVKSGQTKPTGWTGNGLDASGAFLSPVDDTVGSDTYSFYILKDYLSRNHDDGDIHYIPRTT